MPRITGNELWHQEIAKVQRDWRNCIHWRDAEIELFVDLFKRQRTAGLSMTEIRKNFEENYGLKYGAFYSRLRRAGMQEPLI